MPAKRPYEIHGLRFEVEPVEPPEPVYFTDQSPEFKITITNTEQSETKYSEDNEIRWTVDTDPMQVVHSGKVEFGPLDIGDKETHIVGGEKPMYDGHSVVGIDISGVNSLTGSGPATVEPGRNQNGEPVYSFSVWDRFDYEASVKGPKRLQKGAILTSVVLIVFAFVQVVLAISGI